MALNDVPALSFGAGGQNMTVPVESNVWVYQGKKSVVDALPLTFHSADGSPEADWYGTFRAPSRARG